MPAFIGRRACTPRGGAQVSGGMCLNESRLGTSWVAWKAQHACMYVMVSIKR